MKNSAGKVGGGNDGKTDKGRGSVDSFTYNKGKRNTGKVAGGVGNRPNTVEPETRTVKDPRLV